MARSGYVTISQIWTTTLTLVMIIILASQTEIKMVNADSTVPCFFIFGDSLSDKGNNNFRLTVLKANYGPYGVDFPGGVATGRFNNGPVIVDYIAKLLGFANFIPPFATAAGNQSIMKGVNYASGGAGIQDETSYHLRFLLSMDKQLNNHEITVSRITNNLVSPQIAQTYLKKCIYFSGIGNNDYLNNYFLPKLNNTRREFTPEQFAQVLINQYRGQSRLYDLNARNIILVGNVKIGCTPYAISKFGTNGSVCVENLNNASQLFEEKLLALVQEFITNYTDALFVFINTTGIASGVTAAEGFTIADQACCKVITSLGTCIPLTAPCPNRRQYVFYDNLHQTTAVSNFTAVRFYTARSASDAIPIDIKRLAELQL